VLQQEIVDEQGQSPLRADQEPVRVVLVRGSRFRRLLFDSRFDRLWNLSNVLKDEGVDSLGDLLKKKR
jgi:hypothetical protein